EAKDHLRDAVQMGARHGSDGLVALSWTNLAAVELARDRPRVADGMLDRAFANRPDAPDPAWALVYLYRSVTRSLLGSAHEATLALEEADRVESDEATFRRCRALTEAVRDVCAHGAASIATARDALRRFDEASLAEGSSDADAQILATVLTRVVERASLTTGAGRRRGAPR
ncbi:MAG: hypothetical protein AAF602_16735, partial [Myxococcota bacterium]